MSKEKFTLHPSWEAYWKLEVDLTTMTEQRDRLAEALESMWPFIEEDDQPNCNTPAFSMAIAKYKTVLTSVEGGPQ